METLLIQFQLVLLKVLLEAHFRINYFVVQARVNLALLLVALISGLPQDLQAWKILYLLPVLTKKWSFTLSPIERMATYLWIVNVGISKLTVGGKLGATFKDLKTFDRRVKRITVLLEIGKVVGD